VQSGQKSLQQKCDQPRRHGEKQLRITRVKCIQIIHEYEQGKGASKTDLQTRRLSSQVPNFRIGDRMKHNVFVNVGDY
jgi:hypothetical protein